MVAVYNTFGDVEAVRPASSTNWKKYAAVIAGAWAVMFVAAVMVIGAYDKKTTLYQRPRMQMLAFKEFVPETNVFENFDASFTPEKKFEYDLAKEADYSQINIASGVDGDTVEEGIPDPYADQSARIEVPAAVYTQDPPYDPTVVEIGEKVLGKPFHEYTAAEEGDPVMGKDYEDVPFDKTINSVPEPNPSREWESLDVENEPNPNY